MQIYAPSRGIANTDGGLVGLAQLEASRHAIRLAILDGMRSRLVEAEGDVRRNALSSDVKYPFVATWPGISSCR